MSARPICFQIIANETMPPGDHFLTTVFTLYRVTGRIIWNVVLFPTGKASIFGTPEKAKGRPVEAIPPARPSEIDLGSLPRSPLLILPRRMIPRLSTGGPMAISAVSMTCDCRSALFSISNFVCRAALRRMTAKDTRRTKELIYRTRIVPVTGEHRSAPSKAKFFGCVSRPPHLTAFASG
jgi:hypothetical protein